MKYLGSGRGKSCMAQKRLEVLIVEEDGALAADLAREIEAGSPCNTTLVSSASDALREELTAHHDLVLTSLDLPDGDGLTLVRELRAENRCPVLLLADEISADEAIEAMRLGVIDVLPKPPHLDRVAALVSEMAEHEIRHRREQSRQRRLRRTASRIIRERRDFSQRIDLICRDFVQAYRRLAQKVCDSGLLAPDQIDEL